MTLDKMLVCPVCHSELPLAEIRRSGKGSCTFCTRVYSYQNNIYDMIPVPLPDEDVLKRWKLWEKLQLNGLIAYQLAPEASCAICGRADVAAWKQFLDLKPRSRVLDIGCGPMGTPEYLKGWHRIAAVGIDPLMSVGDIRGMIFIKGIGEYLPFRNSSFDSIILATSLDHVLSPPIVMAEVKRCLAPSGNVLIWFWQQPSPPQEASEAIEVTEALEVSEDKQEVSDISKPFWQQVNESLKVPEGAIDVYHFRKDNETEIQDWYTSLGFRLARRNTYNKYNVFLELRLQ